MFTIESKSNLLVNQKSLNLIIEALNSNLIEVELSIKGHFEQSESGWWLSEWIHESTPQLTIARYGIVLIMKIMVLFSISSGNLYIILNVPGLGVSVCFL